MRGRIHGMFFFLACSFAHAQDTLPAAPPSGAVAPNSFTPSQPSSASAAVSTPSVSTPSLSAPSVDEKWRFFVSETATPLLILAVGTDATVSQLTRSAPLYGKHFWHHHAYLKRVGATAADNASENFFADFVLASAFHEDTRYVRQGSSHHGVLWRMGYAVSRSVVTRTDEGNETFNWANVVGCAMSAALSNAYYPPISRTRGVALTNWGTNVAGSGLSNFMPELGPDVGRFFKRHLFHRQ